NWKMLKEHFDVFERWNAYRKPGAWPDGDMLPLGRIGIRAERGDNRMTKFTKDEQFTLMTLWTIFRSPLMFGGDLPSNDAFTLSLLNNKEVIYVLKNSINNKQLLRTENEVVWVADDPKTGDKFVAVFNPTDQSEPQKITIDLKQLGFNSNAKIRNLWMQENIGSFSTEFSPQINKHGAGLYRISPK
ncbi:MAG: alpha-galactosidase, partial [Sphingobacteriaceae bacterium]